MTAILPAATDELHHNVDAHFLGDKDAGRDGSSFKQNPAYEPGSTILIIGVYTIPMLQTIWGTQLPPQAWYVPLTESVQFTGVTLASLGMRLLIAGIVLLVGYLIVRLIQSAAVKMLESVRNSKLLEHSPLSEYTKQPELAKQVESIISSVIFWLLMLVVFDTASSAAGFTSLERLFSRILSYVPSLFVATIILLLGTLLAGFAESVVKNSMRSFDPRGGRLMGKISSYVVMVLTVLIAISELGIAKEYILVLFIGFVATMTIGFGLALGLGGQHLMKDLLQRWYDRVIPAAKDQEKAE